MIIGISVSCISSVIIFGDLMLSGLKAAFRMAQNNNAMIVIPIESTKLGFQIF